ncbi:MAG: response regulator [Myxococcota bacterium]
MLDGTHAALKVPVTALDSLEEGLLALERLPPPLRRVELRRSPDAEVVLALLGFDDHRSFIVQRASLEALARLLSAELIDVAHLEGEARRAFAEQVARAAPEAKADGNIAEAFAQLRQHRAAHTLRVSFGSDDELLDAWARSVAEGGLWVPTSAPVEGDAFRVIFVTPEATYPANPATRLHRPATRGRDGLWLEVQAGDALSSRIIRAQQERRDRLARLSPPPIERFDSDLDFAIDTLAQLGVCWAQELSRSALFLPTPNPPALRARLRLHLRLPDGKLFTLPAEVVHRVIAGPRPGVGLQLTMNAEVGAAVQELLATEPRRRPRVLVVDDEAIWRSTLVRLLKELDADIVLAKDGREGLTRLIDHFFELDLVVLDLHMPELDGRALLDRVRRLGGEQALRIFLFSAAAREDLKAAGQQATGIFSKLDPLHVLAERLAKELGREWPPSRAAA